MLVKKLQNLSAIFVGSVNVSLSDVNLVGVKGLLFRLLITLFTSFHVNFKSLLALSNLLS